MWGSKMVIFGGFVSGQRVNDIWILDLDTFKWTEVNATGTMPEPRAGHSCVFYQDALYVFGGKDEENNKLSDFWSFNLTTNIWT
jgi:N-acetylneuraminic acid mutarotase